MNNANGRAGLWVVVAMALGVSGAAQAQLTTVGDGGAPVALPSQPEAAAIVPGDAILDEGDVDAMGLSVHDAVARIGANAGAALTFDRRLAFGGVLVHVNGAPDAVTTEAVIARVLATGVRVIPNRILYARQVPTDPFFPQMWNLDAIGAPAAWDMTVGSSSQRIGVVDSGIVRQNPDLKDKDIAGFDFVSDPATALDGDGRDADYEDAGDGVHGTHVSGTILASANNEFGTMGINWSAGLVTARAIGKDGGGSMVDVLEGVAWMAGIDVDGVPPLAPADRPRVINMSVGAGAPCDAQAQAAVDQLLATGILLVAAAGNDGGAVQFPANCKGVIAVAALSREGAMTTYSSHGPEITIVAPGGEGTDLFHEGVPSSAKLDKVDFLEGTSMAAPHVTGVISLMLDVNPKLSNDEVKKALVASGVPCDGCEDKPALRADEAVAAVAPPAVKEHKPLVDAQVSCGSCAAAPGESALALAALVCIARFRRTRRHERNAREEVRA